MKYKLFWLIKTNAGRLILSIFMVAFFGLLTKFVNENFIYPALAFLAYPVGVSLVMLFYAWVINPYRDYKANKK